MNISDSAKAQLYATALGFLASGDATVTSSVDATGTTRYTVTPTPDQAADLADTVTSGIYTFWKAPAGNVSFDLSGVYWPLVLKVGLPFGLMIFGAGFALAYYLKK